MPNIRPDKRYLLILMLAIGGFVSATPVAAQTAPEEPEASEAPSGDGTGWEPVDPSGLIEALKPELLNAPRTHLLVRIAGRDLSIEPLDIRIGGADSGIRDPDFERARENLVERWPLPNGRIRRFLNDGWASRLLVFKSGARKAESAFLRYRIKEKGLNAAKEIHSIEISKLTVQCLPQTWENIWLAQVASVAPELRLKRLKAFDAAFSAVIENRQSRAEWFSREERAAYARFYQEQFAFVRDRNPANPEIYQELADFHESRDNVDALIEVYLDAIMNEVPEEALRLFQLRLGQLLCLRLKLFSDAIPHLDAASVFAQGRLLLVHCLLESNQFGRAAENAKALIELLLKLEAAEPTESSEAPLLRFDSEDPREPAALLDEARLLHAKALLGVGRLDEAFVAFQPLLENDSLGSLEATVMYASMLVYRGRPSDRIEARRIIQEKPVFQAAIRASAPAKEGAEVPPVPYDPLTAKALCVLVEAQIDPRTPQRRDNLVRLVVYASKLDPLSADAFLVMGRMDEIANEHWAAFTSYQAGLSRNPRDHRLRLVIGELLLRSGALDDAAFHFQESLKSAPEYYPALNGLADVALMRAEREENGILSLEGDGERQQAVNRIVALQRQASASLAASLALQPRQSAVRNRLASLNTLLAASSPTQEIRLSYLRGARDLAAATMAEARTQGEEALNPTVKSPYELAATPHLSAFVTYAYASYEMYALTGETRLYKDAVSALQDVTTFGLNGRYFSSPEALKEFASSSWRRWATSTLSRIQANDRRRRQSEAFADRTISATDRRNGDMGKGWKVLPGEKPDRSFLTGLEVRDGHLTIAVKEQQKDGQISRLSRQESFGTLAGFHAKIPYLGTSELLRGIHVTRVTPSDDGKSVKEAWSLLVGFDAENALFWDLREGVPSDGVGTSALLEGRQYLDLKRYGIDSIDPQAPLSLGIERELSSSMVGNFEWILTLNGYRIRLPVDERNVQSSLLTSCRAVSETIDKASDGLRFGFFTLGRAGASGALVVDEAEWFHDSDLAVTGGK